MCEQSGQIYGSVEEIHELGHTWPLRLSLGTIVLAFCISAMLPVSYAIFGYPSPQQWRLPVDTQWVHTIRALFEEK